MSGSSLFLSRHIRWSVVMPLGRSVPTLKDLFFLVSFFLGEGLLRVPVLPIQEPGQVVGRLYLRLTSVWS